MTAYIPATRSNQRALQRGDADRLHDNFLPIIAHELRQPLNAIVMALGSVPVERGDASHMREPLEIARHQALLMSQIVDDMLDTFCGMRGETRLNIQTTDLVAVVNDAIETSRPMIASRGHSLSVSLPRETVLLMVDSSRLQRVLTNLLTNAAKYTDPGGHIHLTASATPDGVVLRVRDNGRGISQELLHRIFDLYQRGPHHRERGLGLGLSLVKSLVELHGGSVTAHSQGLGMGSEFVVCLPATTGKSTAISLGASRPGVALSA